MSLPQKKYVCLHVFKTNIVPIFVGVGVNYAIHNIVCLYTYVLYILCMFVHGLFPCIYVFVWWFSFCNPNVEVSSYWQFSIMLSPALWHSTAKQPGDAWLDGHRLPSTMVAKGPYLEDHPN